MNGNKTSGKKILKSLVHLSWLSSSFINFRKFGLFDTGSCQKFKQEMLVEWNLPGGGRVEEWQGFFQVLKYVTPLTTLLIFFRNHDDTPWFEIFTSPAVWGIIVAHFCDNWGFYTFLTCLPSYFKEVLNFSISQVRKTHCYRSLVE